MRRGRSLPSLRAAAVALGAGGALVIGGCVGLGAPSASAQPLVASAQAKGHATAPGQLKKSASAAGARVAAASTTTAPSGSSVVVTRPASATATTKKVHGASSGSITRTVKGHGAAKGGGAKSAKAQGNSAPSGRAVGHPSAPAPAPVPASVPPANTRATVPAPPPRPGPARTAAPTLVTAAALPGPGRLLGPIGAALAGPGGTFPLAGHELSRLPGFVLHGGWAQDSLQATARLRLPLGFLLAAAVFVLVQGLIDRRDPKVVRAPEHQSDDSVGFG